MSTRKNITEQEALSYHKQDNKPGKISIRPTKPLLTQYDLSLAYSPGVAYPCLEIQKNPDAIYEYTSKGNTVAVISNGTAVLGLGNLGAAASKPVMEGKAVLFKKFADVDAIDIEVSTEDPNEFINAIKYLSASWGGINLEDIKAPECFYIEEKLKELLDIPVFHDDQHGTAVITAAGLINATRLSKKKLSEVKILVNGAGAAAIACIKLIIKMGAKKENIVLCDTRGVIYKGRTDGMNQWKEEFASETSARSLTDAFVGADVFLGLSAKDAVTKDMVKLMANDPIIFAMANPDPEITPEDILSVRSDAIIATGRSDYNNQVNNVMGFPYIFRGALDVRASTINYEMMIAAAEAIAMLARKPVSEVVSRAYSGKKMSFGPDYIIPAPFDPRLIEVVPFAVAKAAVETGVARKKDFDFAAYRKELSARLNPASSYMSMIFSRIESNKQRIIFAEGEEEEVIKAATFIRDNNYADCMLVGAEHKIKAIMDKLGSDYNLDNIKIVNAANTDNTEKYIDFLYSKLQRTGYLHRDCARLVKRDRNIFASCMLHFNDADALVTGHTKSYFNSLSEILTVIPEKPGNIVFSYSILISKGKNIIIADTSVNELPSAEDLANIAIQTADIAKKMGYNPRVAFLSYSNFGNPMKEKSQRMRDAVDILDHLNVDFEYEGEMNPDVALNMNLMKLYPFSRLTGPANILIMPALNTSSIATKLIQELGEGYIIGPILTGLTKPVQIIQMGTMSEEIVDISAFAAIDAINKKS